MKSTTVLQILSLTIVALFLMAGGTAFAESSGDFGAVGAAARVADWSIEAMLKYAIEDEYLARAEYVAIMKKFGVIQVFDNIKKSEDQHIGWLKEIYEALSLAIPEDLAAAHVIVPATLKEAWETGIKAEIANIGMYEQFIKTPLVNQSENVKVLELFKRLKAASENHLAAFRRQAGR